MKCPTCQVRTPGAEKTCPACGHALPLPDLTGPALAATLFGCLPLGLLARGFASEAKVKLALGDEHGAWASVRQARQWCWKAAVVGAGMWGAALLGLFLAP